jgi:hypothetical protein
LRHATLAPAPAAAQKQTIFRNSLGQTTGTATTNSNGTVTFRDASGRTTGTPQPMTASPPFATRRARPPAPPRPAMATLLLPLLLPTVDVLPTAMVTNHEESNGHEYELWCYSDKIKAYRRQDCRDEHCLSGSWMSLNSLSRVAMNGPAS